MKAIVVLSASLAGAILFSIPVAAGAAAPRAVGESFDAAPDPAWWKLNGSAAWDVASKAIVLTDASANQTGSIFWAWQINNSWLDASFDFWIGGGSGGEGLTFAWVKAPTLLGDEGRGLGFDGLDGYAIRFDTRSNGPGEPDNYVAFSRSTPDGRTDLIVNSEIPEIENVVDSWGNPAPFHVKMIIQANVLVVWLSNPTAATPIPETKILESSLPDFALYEAYFGFTAATSEETNIHLVDNMVVRETGMVPPSIVVYSGDLVTLDGFAGGNPISYSWKQIDLWHPIVTLDNPTPPFGISHFIAPEVSIGQILIFELTVEYPDGPQKCTIDVVVRPAAPPRFPLILRVLPINLGFIVEWELLVEADEYIVEVEVRPAGGSFSWTVRGSSCTFRNLTEGNEYLIWVTARNKFGKSLPGGPMSFFVMRNLALPSSLGGTRPPLPPVQGQTYVLSRDNITRINDGDDSTGTGSFSYLSKREDFWGYIWDQPYFFDHIAYYTGPMYGDGGWFTSLKVQFTEDGITWKDAPILHISPEYDFTDSDVGKRPFTRYDISIRTLRGTGVRIYGTPGGTSTFTSISELEVYGLQTKGPIIAQGIDAVYPEGSTATLDGSFCFSTAGPLTSYAWSLVSGPPDLPITIENANSPVASFKAPIVNKDEVFVFSLTASDGTFSATDNDVRITVKNLVTAADAGPDQRVTEGTLVTLDGSGSLSTTGTLTYLWMQTAGMDVGVSGKTAPVVSFIARRIWAPTEDLIFQLTVNDGAGGVSTDEVKVQVRNPHAVTAYPLGPGYMKDLLHSGSNPTDGIRFPLGIDVDQLSAFGGQAFISPVEGDAYDFTDTGVTVTRNPMVWTPLHSNDGFFGTGLVGDLIQYYHVYVFSPYEREARLHFRHSLDIRIWNNGVLVVSRDSWDNRNEQTQDFTLYKGVNSMTWKFRGGIGGSYIAVGITDRSDQPYDDLQYTFGPSLIPGDAYAVRILPMSYTPGGTIEVELLLKVNPNNQPNAVTVRERIPPGLTEWNVVAPGAVVSGGNVTWSLAGAQVKTCTIGYSLKIPVGAGGPVSFAGIVAFGAISTDILGDSAISVAPGEPRNLEVEMLEAAHLSWQPPPESGIAGYNVYRSVDRGPWEKIAYVTGTSYVDNTVVEGKFYQYKVSAINNRGVEGPACPPVPSLPDTLPTMVIREAEDFNYGGGNYPGFKECPAANEAPSATSLDSQYDFWHPNKGGPRTYRPLDAIGIETVLDDGTTDVYHTNIGWIDVGAWWKYTFNVTQAGWIKLDLRVAAPTSSTMAAYWDDQLIGATPSFATGSWHTLTWAALEDQIQTTTGVHTLRVQSVAGGMNFDRLAIGFNWAAPKRKAIWSDNFDSYSTTAEVKATGGWGIVDNSSPKDPNAAWQLWDTEDDLGSNPGNLEGMNDKYMISNSDFAPSSEMDEELVSPVIDCSWYVQLRLNFAKNFRVYSDDDEDDPQIGEVDVRAYEDATGWSGWVTVLHLDKTMISPALEPTQDALPEQIGLSAYDGKKIQIRWHFYAAFFDYWLAVDDVKVSGQPAPPLPPPPGWDGRRLVWSPFGNGVYTVQYTDNLVGWNWTSVPGMPITATVWPGEDIRGLRKRFYRVMSSSE